MEEVRSFLESSTIHGLAYISLTRRSVRVFWILVVIAGFIGAGVLIFQSFHSWEASPEKTTIRTMSIQDVKFPKVTVCPPRDTYTNLNYDLMIAPDIKLDIENRGFPKQNNYMECLNTSIAINLLDKFVEHFPNIAFHTICCKNDFFALAKVQRSRLSNIYITADAVRAQK